MVVDRGMERRKVRPRRLSLWDRVILTLNLIGARARLFRARPNAASAEIRQSHMLTSLVFNTVILI